MLGYNLEPSVYFLLHQQIGYRTQVENISSVYNVALYQFLFFILFTLLIKYPSKGNITNINFIGRRNSSFIFNICILLFVICLIKGKSGQNIFQSGGYADTMKNIEVSSLYGYGIIFMGVGLVYANTKKKLRLLMIASAIYVLKDLSFGGRIDSIMLILLWFITYFQYYFKKKTILIIAIIAFIFNSFFELFRLATSGELVQLISNGNFMSLTTGNSGEVYYASMRIVYMIENSYLAVSDRISSAFYFILSSIVPYSSLPDIANLSQYQSDTFGTGGGGLGSIFIYAMFGIPGVALLGWFIANQFNNLTIPKCRIGTLFYSVLIVITTPRWFAYYPIAIIKYCVFGFLFLSLMFALERILSSDLRTKSIP